MTRREQLAAAIEKAQTEAAELDALALELDRQEKVAVANAVRENPGRNAYSFGTSAERARKGARKAREDREKLQVHLDALAVEMAQEIAEEANEKLAAAIEKVRSHRPNVERIFADAGSLMAGIAQLWIELKGEIEGFDRDVASGRGLAEAAVTNPDAVHQWNDATFTLSDLGPAPCNIAYFAEIVLAAALDPEHDDEYRINAMRCDVGIPDLREFNVPAHFSGERLVKRGGSGFADAVQTVARRNEPKPEPAPPSPEQLANIAALAAEEERRFQARLTHESKRRGYVSTPPQFTVAPRVDPDADPTEDPTGLGLSEKQQRELAELQTR